MPESGLLPANIIDDNTVICAYKNIAEISENLRELKLIVDRKLEYNSVLNDMLLLPQARVKELLEQRTGDKDITYWQPDNRKNRLIENEKQISLYEQHNAIRIMPYIQETYNFGNEETEPFPLIDILSGAQINIPCGEGILDFIYADFDKGYRSASNKTQEKRSITFESYDTLIERNVADHVDFKKTLDCFGDLIYSSVYSAAFPPVMANRTKALLQNYYDYLKSLQSKIFRLLEFCFDEAFYPEILGGKSAAQRYALYCRLNHIDRKLIRNEIFEIQSFEPENLPKYVTASDLYTSEHDKPEYKDFCEQFDIRSTEVDAILNYPASTRSFYECDSIESLLELELIQAIKIGICFRKCKRCGKYFIMKGNYDTNYCDRIIQGEMRNCQDIAAQENYKRKIAGNAAIPIYSKYYKRYAARVRVNQLKEADFKQWKYTAMTKRDECSDGKITANEYIQWMEECFPNRISKK